MSVLKCKMCGGQLNISADQNIVVCPYCGSSQTVPFGDDEKKISLYQKGNELRLNNFFDKAFNVYLMIVSEFPKEAEAYWGLVLCKYGTQYVDDPQTKHKVIVCHHTLFKSIFDDPDYKKTIELSDAVSRELYFREAKEIDELQKKILQSVSNEQFDVFICYKETDFKGNRTEDSVIAQEIYQRLINEGYKVFFSRITLQDKIGTEYEPTIFAALNTAKIMIHVTTSKEYTNSLWVRNEWERYLEKMDFSKTIIPCFKDVSSYELPSELNRFQGVDLTKIGAYQDIVFGVNKLLKNRTSANQLSDSFIHQPEIQIDELAPVYNRHIKTLSKVNDYVFSASDFKPMILFFTDNLNYKNSKMYLARAKSEFILRASTYEECVEAQRFIQDIKDEVDTTKMSKRIKDRKNLLRNQYLTDKKLLFDTYSNDINSFLETLSSFVTSRRLFIKYTDKLSPADKNKIINNQTSAIETLQESYQAVIDKATEVATLDNVKSVLQSMDKEGIEEVKCFDTSLLDKRIENIKKENKIKQAKKRRKIFIIILSIVLSVATVTGVIVGIVSAYNYNHSPKALSFEVTNVSSEYHPNESPYVNGCYYVYFTYSISSNSSVGVDYLDLVTTISQNSSQIGKIRSSFENMSLSPHSSQTYTAYLKDNQPEENGNTFFIKLYNSDISTLSFSYHARSISFSDGRWYFAPDDSTLW